MKIENEFPNIPKMLTITFKNVQLEFFNPYNSYFTNPIPSIQYSQFSTIL